MKELILLEQAVLTSNIVVVVIVCSKVYNNDLEA